MKKIFALILAMILLTPLTAASAERPDRRGEEEERIVDLDTFFSDLAAAQRALQLIDEDTKALND